MRKQTFSHDALLAAIPQAGQGVSLREALHAAAIPFDRRTAAQFLLYRWCDEGLILRAGARRDAWSSPHGRTVYVYVRRSANAAGIELGTLAALCAMHMQRNGSTT